MKAEWPKRLEYKSFLYFGTFYSLFHTFDCFKEIDFYRQ